MSFPSTARRMQRFRQPHKIQGPLFPIEDGELIDAINDYKNLPIESSVTIKDCNIKTEYDKPFDAANYVEVIEVNDDNNVYMDNNDCMDENKNCNEKDNKENIFKNDQKESEKTVNMFCKYLHVIDMKFKIIN